MQKLVCGIKSHFFKFRPSFSASTCPDM